MSLWHSTEVEHTSTSVMMKVVSIKSRRKAEASDLGRGRICIDIGESHLAGCARGFAGLLLKTKRGRFGGLCVKTMSGGFDRFGPQNQEWRVRGHVVPSRSLRQGEAKSCRHWVRPMCQ